MRGEENELEWPLAGRSQGRHSERAPVQEPPSVQLGGEVGEAAVAPAASAEEAGVGVVAVLGAAGVLAMPRVAPLALAGLALAALPAVAVAVAVPMEGAGLLAVAVPMGQQEVEELLPPWVRVCLRVRPG